MKIQENNPNFIGSRESISDAVFIYGVGKSNSYQATVKSIIGYNGCTYKNVNDVTTTINNGNLINTPDTNELDEEASIAIKDIFEIEYGNHVKWKCTLEENISKSPFLIIWQCDTMIKAKSEAHIN